VTDFPDGNLYVGTSASELLHFFQIPPDPADKTGNSTFILASRLKPAYVDTSTVPGVSRPGVQQILLLPQVGKACVLCNWTATFYSLPELSPILTQVQVKNCNWIGGVDLNESPSDGRPASGGVTMLLSLNRRIQVVRIVEDARVIKKIDFAGSTISVRRDTIACVADSRTYALLDVERQLKIPLMSISSLDDSQPSGIVGQVQSIQSIPDGGLLRSASSAQARPHLGAPEASSHTRSTSLGGFIAGTIRRQDKPPPAENDDLAAQEPEPPVPPPKPNAQGDATSGSNQPVAERPASAASGAAAASGPARSPPVFLKPHIVSPTPEEFLLVTGTGPQDPGIGMFVNMDGDPTRPTLEFARYPKEVVVDGGAADLASSRPSIVEEEEGYVLASMTREFHGAVHHGLEIQRWDVNNGEDEPAKSWLEAPAREGDTTSRTTPLGIRLLLGSNESRFLELSKRLRLQKFSPFSSHSPEEPAVVSLRHADSRTDISMERVSKERDLFERETESSDEEVLPDGWEAQRNSEEEAIANNLAKTTGRLAVWTGKNIWWALRNPLILRLEAGLDANSLSEKVYPETAAERRQMFAVLNTIRGRDAKSELEFMTFSYIRQRAGAQLFMSFLHSTEAPYSEPESKALEEVLLDGSLDPRIILALIPGLRNDIIQSRRGIWLFSGVKESVERYLASDAASGLPRTLSALEPRILQFLKRCLTAWRRKKGFPSISVESQVFRTVDAALLAVLLELDRASPKGLARSGSIRAELNEVVDKGVDCFGRAVDLLESHHRLYILSRLYQSRKMRAEVLATWRRIVEGERDDGGEFQDGEQRVRDYLAVISNGAVVQEYGLWLANRNPKLGVQVFADDKGKAPKFEPNQVVSLLRQEAPDAVKYYLEHLVLEKGHTAYVNELITYYLDVVITDLQSSASSRETVASSLEAYRALRPPKPTYHHFLADNAPPDSEVWQSRLRLLQLLGGAHDYDAAAIRDRIASSLPADEAAEQLLVPEVIILAGRERRHEDALRLLVHRLGDYDTAVAYCLRGGATLYAARRESNPPGRSVQTQLFRTLLHEFLALEDASDRAVQTGALLERFGGWFDVLEVLELIPDGWSVGLAAEFIVCALQRLVRERHESMVAKALSGAENLKVNYELITKVEEKGPQVEARN